MPPSSGARVVGWRCSTPAPGCGPTGPRCSPRWSRSGPVGSSESATVALDDHAFAELQAGAARPRPGCRRARLDRARQPRSGRGRSGGVRRPRGLPRTSRARAHHRAWFRGRPAPLGAERVAWLARAAQLSGVLGTAIPAVAVARSRVPAPGALDDLVAGILDDAPMVLPVGSASRLVEVRRRAADVDGVVADAVTARHLAEEREARMVDQLRRLDHDLMVERVELEKLRKEHAARPSRRLARAVQRSTGPPALNRGRPTSGTPPRTATGRTAIWRR